MARLLRINRAMTGPDKIRRYSALTQTSLGHRLGRFEIHPRTMRIGNVRARGYEVSDFTEAFRFLKDDPQS